MVGSFSTFAAVLVQNILALGVNPGDEAHVYAPYSFVTMATATATAQVDVSNGATPSFVLTLSDFDVIRCDVHGDQLSIGGALLWSFSVSAGPYCQVITPYPGTDVFTPSAFTVNNKLKKAPNGPAFDYAVVTTTFTDGAGYLLDDGTVLKTTVVTCSN